MKEALIERALDISHFAGRCNTFASVVFKDFPTL